MPEEPTPAACGGDWRAELEPEARHRILRRIIETLLKTHAHLNHCQELSNIASQFESKIYNDATSRAEYLRKISLKMMQIEHGAQRTASASLARQEQAGYQMQSAAMNSANPIPGLQRNNASMSGLGESTLTSSSRQAPQLQSRSSGNRMEGYGTAPKHLQVKLEQQQILQNHMQHSLPFSPQTQRNLEQEQSAIMLNQILSSQLPAVTQMTTSSLQSGQLAMMQQRQNGMMHQSLLQQSAAKRNQRRPAVAQPPSSSGQGLPGNYPNYHSPYALQLPGNPSVRPNMQQNQLLRHSMQPRQGQPNNMMNQQPFMVSHSDQFRQVVDASLMQQHLDQQNHRMLGAQIDHSAAQIFQQNAGPARTRTQESAILQSQLNRLEQEAFQQQLMSESPAPPTPSRQRLAGHQQTNSLRQEIHQSPQTSARMENASEVDWKEEIFQKIKSMRDAFFSELLELDRTYVPGIPKHEGLALSAEQTEIYSRKMQIKQAIRSSLKFLQVQKSCIDERLKELFPQYQKTILNLVGQQRKRKAALAQRHADNQSQNPREQAQVAEDTQMSGVSEQQQKQQLKQQQPKQELLPLRNQSQRENARLIQQQQQNQQLLMQQHSSSANKILHLNKTNDANNSKLRQSFVTRPPAQQLLGTNPNFPNVPLPAFQAASHQFQQRLSTQLEEHNASSPSASVKSSTLSGDYGNLSDFLLPDNAATPRISASPLLAELTSHQGENRTSLVAESQVAKKPVSRLVEAVLSSSAAALRSSCSAIASVVSSNDRITASAALGGGRPPIIEDLSATARDHIQDPRLLLQGGCNTPKNMKRLVDCTLSRSASPVGSTDESSVTCDLDAAEPESTGASNLKRQRVEVRSSLLDEITAINRVLIDTVISISDDQESKDGTVIKFSYSAVSLGPCLKSLLAPSQMSIVTPAKLFVPADYPRSSPILLDDLEDDQPSDISAEVKPVFQADLHGLPQPMSVKEMARAWDACVRKAITEFAHRHGGGTFSSRYGNWQNCVGAR